MSMEKAKRIFFDHLGSGFLMFKADNGVINEYNSFNISKDQEKIWLNELTKIMLDKLNEPGNWWTIFFLNHHSDFKYLNRIFITKPMGNFNEKCAFLEELIKYAENASLTRTELTLTKNYTQPVTFTYLLCSACTDGCGVAPASITFTSGCFC